MAYDFRPAGDEGWLAIAAGPRLLLTPSLDDVRAAWTALRGERGFEAALELLTSRGLTATPPFVLLDWTEGADARLVVRGGATVAVQAAAGPSEIRAEGVSTWVERAVESAGRITVTIPGATASGPELPLADGAARVSAIAASGAEHEPATRAVPAVPAPKPAPEPAEEPEPADVEATVVVPEFDEPAPVAAEPVQAEAAPESYDYLFGDTVFRSVADAAVREEEPEQNEEAAGDHDGQTVLTSDIAKLRSGRKRGVPEGRPDAAAPPVQHALVTADGGREPLTQPLIVGRSPSVSKVSGGQLPRLLTVGGGDQDISRNHVQFAVEGGTVVVTDLHSKNGTTVTLPGKDAQKLRAGEPTSVIAGTVVDLGGGVTFTVDEG